MGAEQGGTLAARVFAQLPQLRDRIAASPDFAKWRDAHSSFLDEGTRFYVVGGDMSRDEEELMLNWARARGLVDPELIAKLAADAPSEFE